MQVVLLCGGKGTRLQEHTVSLPKPLIEIGGYPILWHIMRYYSHFGHKEFVLTLGYLGAMIKEFFVNHQEWRYTDFRLRLGDGRSELEPFSAMEKWDIIFAETGLETNTGGRVKRIERYIEGDAFLANYSDGLSNIDLHRLVAFHRAHGKIATLAAVRPVSPFGLIDLAPDGRVRGFQEKPELDMTINGGFFVFNRAIFEWMSEGDNLETDTFPRLAEAGELMAYQHDGFWECMDTYKHCVHLNSLWDNDQAPWKVWGA